MMRKMKQISWALYVLTICKLNASCSNDDKQSMQDYLQNEFISTYTYVTTNHPVENNMSSWFTHMNEVNSSAFNSIAFRWHNLAIDICEIYESNRTPSRKNSYEKLLEKNIDDKQFIKITTQDRSCLANVYLSHWTQINNMLLLSFPNIK